ncbi:hypothetical protein Scep_026580 [Stephania cephalantha]|uniref:Uncharacterized protein n=1 Tax=Stephania cephalantha TaxID=152367 RepID=A0AAP0EKG1_9MAGN
MDGDRGAPSRSSCYEVSFSTTPHHHNHPHHHPPITILDMGFAHHFDHHEDQNHHHQGLSFLLPSSHHHPHHNSHVVSLPFDALSGATTATSNVDTVGIRSGNDNIDVASTNKASWNNVDQEVEERISREKQSEGEEEAKRTKVLLPNSKRYRRSR